MDIVKVIYRILMGIICGELAVIIGTLLAMGLLVSLTNPIGYLWYILTMPFYTTIKLIGAEITLIIWFCFGLIFGLVKDEGN